MMRNYKLYSLIITIILMLYVFNIFAYQIENFNANLRNFVVTGNLNIRTFDDSGFPISSNPKVEDDFTSPFYIVHYGLMYSELFRNQMNTEGFHWRVDSSMEYWNVKPKVLKQEYFKNAANWLVKNVDTTTYNKAHFLYKFDWPYKGYPKDQLSAPWWSGLTDAYALVLLLRAYDVYKDSSYLRTAKLLYESSVTEYKMEGSLTSLNNHEWIEEYVDPTVKNGNEFAFVLNGMIYSTYGIISYEKKVGITNGLSDKLLNSIKSNINLYDKGNSWSNYDLIGNTANMKYHRVQVALMKDLYEITKNNIFKEKYNKWSRGAKNIGFYWVFFAKSTMSKIMFLFEVAGVVILLICVYLYDKRRISEIR